MHILLFVLITVLWPICERLSPKSKQGGAIMVILIVCSYVTGDLIKEDFLTEQTGDASGLLAQLTPESSKNQVIVFNITADWCLTCKYNHRVFKDKKVMQLFKKHHVKFIEADMTKKDDSLLHFINKHGRVGIPFTAVFGPSASDGILLSEIPTANEIISAVEKAGKLP